MPQVFESLHQSEVYDFIEKYLPLEPDIAHVYPALLDTEDVPGRCPSIGIKPGDATWEAADTKRYKVTQEYRFVLAATGTHYRDRYNGLILLIQRLRFFFSKYKTQPSGRSNSFVSQARLTRQEDMRDDGQIAKVDVLVELWWLERDSQPFPPPSI